VELPPLIRLPFIAYFPDVRWRLCTPAPQTISDGRAAPFLCNKTAPAMTTGKICVPHAGFRKRVCAVLRSFAVPLKPHSLTAAARQTHARRYGRQKPPWHFWSDGSSPLDSVFQRVGYNRLRLVGEVISRTYGQSWTLAPGLNNQIPAESSCPKTL